MLSEPTYLKLSFNASVLARQKYLSSIVYDRPKKKTLSFLVSSNNFWSLEKSC